MNTKIKQLKVKGITYDIDVAKDWSQNNPSAVDFIKNRTHYEDIKSEIIYNKRPPSQSYDYDNAHYYDYNEDGVNIYYAYPIGTTFRVEIDGDLGDYGPRTYSFICTKNDESSSAYGDGGSIMADSHDIFVYHSSASEFHFSVSNIKITAEYRTIVQLDEKYIPDTIARKLDVENVVSSLVDTAPEALNTLNELSKALGDDPNFATTVLTEVGKKVDKESGKGLSTNDFNNTYKKTLDTIKPGTGDNSIVINEGTASGVYSIAGGTTNKDFVDGVTGGIAGALTTLHPSEAIGELSIALGADNKAITAGSMALGYDNIAGGKGYYVTAIDTTNKTITLSTKQTSTSSPGTISWNKGDRLFFVNDERYFIEIASISGNVVTLVDMPFTSLMSTNALTGKPNDRAIINLDKPESGTINIGWGAMSTGIQNEAVGSSSYAMGYKNIVAGDFGTAFGMENIVGYSAFATGNKNNATGKRSFASGNLNNATGNYSHAEGADNKATNDCAHAEGSATTASGMWAHSEGRETIASGGVSHAEGNGTHATGKNSHAEGYQTQAHGENSHAEGIYTKAEGIYSHAEGSGSRAQNKGAHAEGFNTVASGTRAHAEGFETTASGDEAHAEGLTTTAFGKASHAEGTNTAAKGEYSHAEGYNTRAYGACAHTEGHDTEATGEDSHAEGNGTQANSFTSHAEGYQTVVNASYGHAEGYQTAVNGKTAHAEGNNTSAGGDDSHAEGYKTIASGGMSHAEGDRTNASGSKSHAEGQRSLANGENAHAEGKDTTAKSINTHAEGFKTIANGAEQHVQGRYNIEDTEKKYAHIVGNGTGDDNRSNAHTVDWKGNAWFAGDITVGSDNTKILTEKDRTHYDTIIVETVCDVDSKDINYDFNNSPRYYFNLPADNIKSIYEYPVGTNFEVVFYGTPGEPGIPSMYSFSCEKVVKGYEAVGDQGRIVTSPDAGNIDFTIYYSILTHFSLRNIIITAKYGTCVQLDEKYIPDTIARTNNLPLNKATNNAVSQIGTSATGNNAASFGENTSAAGTDSFAEGYNTEAIGYGSHAEGGETIARATYGHAEGFKSVSNGRAAHAEGSETQANNANTHTEGYQTIASGEMSHAEGGNTVASATRAHAEGHRSQATGENAHAEGKDTKATKYNSHAEGLNTIAGGDNQHVQGKYNVELGSDYAHVVGGGTSDSDRKNIHTLDWNGNAYFAGSIKIGNTVLTEAQLIKILNFIESIEEVND